MTNRAEFVEKLKAQIDEWNSKLDSIEKEADTLANTLKEDCEARADEIQQALKEATERIEDLQSKGRDAIDTLKVGAENAWGEIEKAFAEIKKNYSEDS